MNARTRLSTLSSFVHVFLPFALALWSKGVERQPVRQHLPLSLRLGLSGCLRFGFACLSHTPISHPLERSRVDRRSDVARELLGLGLAGDVLARLALAVETEAPRLPATGLEVEVTTSAHTSASCASGSHTICEGRDSVDAPSRTAFLRQLRLVPAGALAFRTDPNITNTRHPAMPTAPAFQPAQMQRDRERCEFHESTSLPTIGKPRQGITVGPGAPSTNVETALVAHAPAVSSARSGGSDDSQDARPNTSSNGISDQFTMTVWSAQGRIRAWDPAEKLVPVCSCGITARNTTV